MDHSPDNRKTSNRRKDTLNSGEPTDLVRRYVVELETDEEVDEVGDHEAGGYVCGFWEVVWNVAKAGPDFVDH